MLLWSDIVLGGLNEGSCFHAYHSIRKTTTPQIIKEQSRKKRTASLMIVHLSYLTDILASHLSLFQPLEQQSYNDWAKVYTVKRSACKIYMGQPGTSPCARHVKRLGGYTREACNKNEKDYILLACHLHALASRLSRVERDLFTPARYVFLSFCTHVLIHGLPM